MSVSEGQPAKLICEKINPLHQTTKELWIQFPSKQDFLTNEQKLFEIIVNDDGDDEIVIYCRAEKAIKKLPKINNIRINDDILKRLGKNFGDENVKVVQSILKK